MTDSNTTIGPGSAVSSTAVTDAELVKPDAQVLTQMQGDQLARQIVLPRNSLKVSCGVGFAPKVGILPGCFCLNSETAITPQNGKLTVIVNRIVPYWRDWPEGAYDSKVELKTYPSKAAAAQAGRTVDWPPRGTIGKRRDAAPGMRLELFIRKPEGCVNEMPFCLLLNGYRYAPALFYVDKSLYGLDEERSPSNRMLTNLRLADAAIRGVPPAEGKPNRYFLTLSVVAGIGKKDPDKTYYTLHVSTVADAAGKPVEVDVKTLQDLVALESALAAPAALEVSDDDVPF